MEVVQVEGLVKRYPLAPAGRLFSGRKKETFCALDGVNFSLEAGDTLGVLGVNGAGKSTLLKLLSGVSAPTEGRVEVHGRIGALLELGAGFSPEATGRENALLSLTIAGFSKKEARAALEEIEAFAGIGRFFDLPVKLYSSGMFVRLAFACATAARPDVLLVDEALSVGDLFFQAKCVRRMKEMLAAGTTLLFVSHDVGAVKSVCRRVLLLDGGKQRFLGPTEEGTRQYFSLKVAAEQPSAVRRTFGGAEQNALSSSALSAWQKKAAEGRLGDGQAQFLSVRLLDAAGQPLECAAFGQEAALEMTVECRAGLPALCLGYHIQNAAGADVIYSDTAVEGVPLPPFRAGERFVLLWKFRLFLGEGSHNIAAVCSVPIDLSRSAVEFCDYVPCAAQFSMQRRPEAKIYSMAYWENDVSLRREFDRKEAL